MAMNLAQAVEMENARIRAGRLGAINFSYRNVAAFQFARDMIAAGELGQIQRMNVRYLQSFLGAESTHWAWRNDIAVAGFGALGDLGVHMLDAACFITGLEPNRLVGIAQTLIPTKTDRDGIARPVTTDTNASFLAEFANGAIGTFETSQVVPGYGNFHHLEISGTRGVVRVCSEENDTLQLLAGQQLSKWGTWSKENFPRINVPTDFLNRKPKSNMESFVRAIRGEMIEYPSFEDGLRTQRCLEAITTSIGTRAWAMTEPE
jgi:predicted dehydrogenase